MVPFFALHNGGILKQLSYHLPFWFKKFKKGKGKSKEIWTFRKRGETVKINCIEKEQIFIEMDIHELLELSDSLEKKPLLTVEENKKMRDIDRIIFAYYRKKELEEK